MMAAEIRNLEDCDRQAVLALAESLAEWFDENARGTGIPIDIQMHRGFVALGGANLVGFATFTTEQGVGRLSWIGVRSELHRQGIGRLLLECVEDALRELGVAKLRVETVGWTEPGYEPYAATRAFYEGMGFSVETKKPVQEAEGYQWQMHDFVKDL
jgi:GNAT superfamily N-acetyltransferase